MPPPPGVPDMYELTEEDVKKMGDQELLAFVRNGGRTGGKGRKGKWGSKTQGLTGWYGKGAKGQDPPPREVGDLRCINCGGTGHTIGGCKLALVDKDKRPCLNCGKPGHKAEGCREKKKVGLERPCFICSKPGHRAADCPDKDGAKNVTKEQAGAENSYSFCVATDDGFEQVATRKPVPKEGSSLKTFSPQSPQPRSSSLTTFSPQSSSQVPLLKTFSPPSSSKVP